MKQLNGLLFFMLICLSVYNVQAFNTDKNTNNFELRLDTACCDTLDSLVIYPYDSLIVMCDTQAVTLSVPYDSCCSYVWYRDGNPIFQIGLENELTTTTSGSYYVVVSNSCYSAASNIVTVIINQPIHHTISKTNVTCYGLCNGSVTVSPSGGTAPYQIVWSNNAHSFSQSWLCAGTYSFVITDTLGCVDSGTVVITQPTQLVVNGSCNCDATYCYLTAQPSGGTPPYSYQWSTGATTQSITTPSAFTTISVTVTDYNDCPKTRGFRRSACVIIKNSIEQEASEETSILVYPNPVTDFVTVEFENEPIDKVQITVFDVTGQIVSDKVESDFQRTVFYVQTNQLSGGVYYVKISSGSDMWMEKIIKE